MESVQIERFHLGCLAPASYAVGSGGVAAIIDPQRDVDIYLEAAARKLWSTFLCNHREAIAAMDFFTAPTLTFRVLYCFFVTEHGRRKILHFNVTEHPTGPWIVQQLTGAFPESCPYLSLPKISSGEKSDVRI